MISHVAENRVEEGRSGGGPRVEAAGRSQRVAPNEATNIGIVLMLLKAGMARAARNVRAEAEREGLAPA